MSGQLCTVPTYLFILMTISRNVDTAAQLAGFWSGSEKLQPLWKVNRLSVCDLAPADKSPMLVNST